MKKILVGPFGRLRATVVSKTMDPIATAAASGLRAKLETLDLLANNLSNASTSGYKLDREFYALFSEHDVSGEAARLPFVARPWTDFAQGILTPTGNPLDLALSGPGLFTVRGPSGPLYTRNGAFQLSRNGQLITQDGYPVLARGDPPMPITVDPQKPVEADQDGFIRQEGAIVGQLDIVEFRNPQTLSKRAGSYFESNGDVKDKLPASKVEVHQGRLENSNVSTSEAAVRIVEVMRQFEMLNRAISLSGDMNRKAVEEVARVSS